MLFLLSFPVVIPEGHLRLLLLSCLSFRTLSEVEAPGAPFIARYFA
jgi:hypothetical protein